MAQEDDPQFQQYNPGLTRAAPASSGTLWLGQPGFGNMPGDVILDSVELARLKTLLIDLVGPFDRIIVSHRVACILGAQLRQIRTAILKICHSKTEVRIEAVERAPVDTPLETPDAEKVARQIRTVLARTARPVTTRLIVPALKKTDQLRFRWQPNRDATARPSASPPKKIIIVGAGIAGVTLALTMLARGHHVRLIDRNPEPLRGCSNQPRLAAFPRFSNEADTDSMLMRHALDLLWHGPLRQSIIDGGRLQLASTALESVSQQRLIQALQLAPESLTYLSGDDASRILAQALPVWSPMSSGATATTPAHHGGLWIGRAVSLDVCALRLYMRKLAAEFSERFALAMNTSFNMQTLQADADAVILTVGESSPALLSQLSSEQVISPRAGWQLISGTSFVIEFDKDPAQAAPTTQRSVRPIIGGPVSVQALDKKRWLFGSSYFDETRESLNMQQQWRQILERAGTLPVLKGPFPEPVGSHTGRRSYVRDRRPLIGPLELNAMPGQWYLATAFGSRGLLWAHLAAQLIADHIDGISPAIGMKALKSIDALRFQ